MSAETAFSPGKKAFLDEEVAPYLTGQEVLVEPKCAYFASCGGCHLQHLAYPDQLAVKRRFLEACLTEAGVPVPSLDGHVHGMTFLAQAGGDELRDAGVVFDDEDTHRAMVVRGRGSGQAAGGHAPA